MDGLNFEVCWILNLHDTPDFMQDNYNFFVIDESPPRKKVRGIPSKSMDTYL